MLGRTGAAEDRQPAQFVGLLVGGRIGQHVRLVVLDADHRVGALGDRLRQPEQIGAGVAARVAAVAVVLERVVDQLVERLPAGARFHGDHRGAECHGLFHRRGRGLLDEYGGRGAEPRGRRLRTGVGAADLLGDPADRLRVGHTEQEEQVGRSRADGQAEPDVVDVDERDRTNRHVQARGAPRPASPSCGPA